MDDPASAIETGAPLTRELVLRHLGEAGEPRGAVLAKTGWLMHVEDAGGLSVLYDAFAPRFEAARREIEGWLGPPDLDVAAVQTFWPEARCGAGWTRGPRVLVLAVEHADRETPIGLWLRGYAQEEIDELRG